MFVADDLGPADREGAIVACGGTGTASSAWSMAAGSEVVAQWTGPSNGNSVWPPEHYGNLHHSSLVLILMSQVLSSSTWPSAQAVSSLFR